MSQENVEIVLRGIDAFNRRDMRGLAELSHEDLEFVSVLTAVDAGGATYLSRVGDMDELLRGMNETWEEWHVEDFQVFDGREDGVAAVFRIVGKGKHSGAPVEHEIGLAYRIRDGKVWRMRSYPDPGHALEAVGLRE